jgi:plastocyanin
MLKRLLSLVCIGGLSAIGLMLWHQPVRAADEVRTTDIKLPGPVFAEPEVSITKGQSIKWVPKTPPGMPHHLVQIMPVMPNGKPLEITKQFTNPDTANKGTHKFDEVGEFKIQCTVHPDTMNQTIKVTSPSP